MTTDRRPVIILAAGEGKRLLHLGKDMPKSMVKINGRPGLSYVLDFWKPYASSFVFVVGYKKEQIIDYVSSHNPGVPVRFVEQDRPAGIAHAVSCAREFAGDDFIVVLSDCLCKGSFAFPASMQQGVGVWETDNDAAIRQSYSIELAGEKITRVVEKPKELVNRYCGMGYYFFNKKVFEYISRTPPSALRNEVEITDVIGNMVTAGEEVKPLIFTGEYLNVTSPDDVERASKIFG